jgi:hypothetical protein
VTPGASTQELRFYVGGLGPDATEEAVLVAFAQVGIALKSARVVLNRATGCSRGFAFVVIDSPPFGPGKTPEDLLERMGGACVGGRTSHVRFVAGPRAPVLAWCAHANAVVAASTAAS